MAREPDTCKPMVLTSEIQLDLLLSIYQHRLITPRQLHRLHAPNRALRGTQGHLAELRGRGLAAAQQSRPWTEAVWYATEAGAQVAELAKVPHRPYRVQPTVAAGQIAAHTLAVNEVGCLLLEAARRRDDDFGPLDWDHEIAHPYRTAKHPGTDHMVIADAVIYYASQAANGDHLSLIRFLELDRGTLSVERLACRVRNYGQMHDYTSGGRPAWRHRYPVFPKLLIVLDGLPPQRLQRRMHMLIDLARQDPHIVQRAEPVSALVTTLAEIQAAGPFSAIFHPLIPHPQFGDRPLNLLLESK
ncbi:replication-relaxation family protein [Actinomadura barringtoniae]|uniref:Replication-relaxation family protein n=1 Tax=Actinomadura barringtoniae TaxID=1427535 RepID=A0A939P9M9_9ACTN|nr:replication-relaxation family protein [Actinomadura barringtoniae]MBO2448707.1 replication-relaxation family protein [Actinomadura barringtoniae]